MTLHQKVQWAKNRFSEKTTLNPTKLLLGQDEVAELRRLEEYMEQRGLTRPSDDGKRTEYGSLLVYEVDDQSYCEFAA